MKNEYKISDIKKVLEIWGQNHPDRKTISFYELEKITKKIRKPLIYSIEEIIGLLSKYITDNQILTAHICKESDVCKILKVKKLALHQWRTKGYIRFIQYNTRAIHYDLKTLLENLQNIRDKNISIDP
jgi:hypothetical protein